MLRRLDLELIDTLALCPFYESVVCPVCRADLESHPKDMVKKPDPAAVITTRIQLLDVG